MMGIKTLFPLWQQSCKVQCWFAHISCCFFTVLVEKRFLPSLDAIWLHITRTLAPQLKATQWMLLASACRICSLTMMKKKRSSIPALRSIIIKGFTLPFLHVWCCSFYILIHFTETTSVSHFQFLHRCGINLATVAYASMSKSQSEHGSVRVIQNKTRRVCRRLMFRTSINHAEQFKPYVLPPSVDFVFITMAKGGTCTTSCHDGIGYIR